MSDTQSQYQRLLDPNTTFAALCNSCQIDPRIRKGIARQGFIRPTLVQSQSLPLAIQNGRDLLVRARTGSGKTLSYVLPILQKVLSEKDNQDKEEQNDGEFAASLDFVKAVILVPTRELCHQVYNAVQSLCF